MHDPIKGGYKDKVKIDKEIWKLKEIVKICEGNGSSRYGEQNREKPIKPIKRR